MFTSKLSHLRFPYQFSTVEPDNSKSQGKREILRISGVSNYRGQV